jgi:hypothetical protein
MSATTSIDHAVSGFLRHRFVRALAGSWVVLTIVGLLSVTAWAAATQKTADAAELAGVGLGVVLVLILFLGPIFLITAIGGAIVDGVHRRLVALAALPVLGIVLAVSLVVGLYLIAEFFGLAPPTNFEATDAAPKSVQIWSLIVLMALSTLMAWEGVWWAWWQLTTSREGFLAARGFRPPPWRLVSTFRRQIGLPPFISNFGRGRVGLTLLYFGEAALNAGLVSLVMLPIFIFSPSRDPGQHEGEVIAVAVLAALFLLNLFRAGRIIDWLADRRAAKIYQDVREWDARAPILFLRAFDQDDAKLPALTRDWFVKFPSGVGSPRTPDEILLEHASPYGPVIAVGDPRDPTPPLGAARIFAPGQGLAWQDIVKGLVGGSRAIVMCPKDTQGVKWELETIANLGARARTIYLANPELPADTNERLFARLAPDGAPPATPQGQAPVAAFIDPKLGWRVLTTSKPPCVQTYVVGLNIALRAMFGEAKLGRMSYKPKGTPEAQVARAA